MASQDQRTLSATVAILVFAEATRRSDYDHEEREHAHDIDDDAHDEPGGGE